MKKTMIQKIKQDLLNRPDFSGCDSSESILILNEYFEKNFFNSLFDSNLNEPIDDKLLKAIDEFLKVSKKELKKEVSTTKRNATKNATEIREKRAREKVVKAINILKFRNEKITSYKIANVAGIHFSTAKKHLKCLNEI